MLDDAADVEERHFGQTGVAVAGEQVLAVFPDRLVHVHTRAVVANDGLRHEGRGLAVLVRNVMHHVLGDLRPVGALDQRAELGANFALTGSRHFVVMHFDRNAERFERQTHRRTDVVQAVDRRNREVAALDRRTVARAAVAFVLLTGSPGRFVRIDLEVAARHVDRPFDAVENEELGFRAKEGGVADAGGLEVSFAALGDRARVAVIAAAVGRVDDVAGQHQRRFVEEGVDISGRRIGHQLHVGRLNTFPASNRRTVEGVPILKLVFVEGADRNGHVLFLATGIGKAEIDELDVVFLDHLDYILRACHMQSLLSGCR